MFGIGGFELFLILIFGFLIFGPDKLPAMAKTLGKAIAKFRDAQEEMSGQLKRESFIDKDSDEPFKNPLDVLEHTAKDVKKGVSSAQAKAEHMSDAVADALDGRTHGEHAAAGSDEQSSDDADRVASFAERKAKYDRERKARKEAQAQAAQEAEAKKRAEDAAAQQAKENPKVAVSQKKIIEAVDDADAAGEEN